MDIKFTTGRANNDMNVEVDMSGLDGADNIVEKKVKIYKSYIF